MPRRPANVTQADIARAIRAMRDAGYTDVRVIVRDGAAIVEAATARVQRPGPDADEEVAEREAMALL